MNGYGLAAAALGVAAVLPLAAGGMVALDRVGRARQTPVAAVVWATSLASILGLGVAITAWSSPVTVRAGSVGLRVDRVGALVLVLITGVGALVTSFAGRSLRGEPYGRRFFALAGVVTSASVVVATSSSLVPLAVAWIVVSAAVVGLIGLTGTQGARRTARRARLVFGAGDAALVVATVLVVSTWGDVDLRDLRLMVDSHPAIATLAAVLVLVTAITRSAQIPAQGWLLGTVWAPTPVSALLHAGVVNAGGLLLVRLWGLVGTSALVTHAALLIGTATLVVGTLEARARGDVKGALAASTVAQMGFMTVGVALGAHAVALLHLVAHGLFKAALFLGSGTAVATSVRARQHPRPVDRIGPGWRASVVVVPVALVVASSVAVKSHGPAAGDVLLGATVAAAAVAAGLAGLHRVRQASQRAGVVLATGVLAAGYLAVAHVVGSALEPSLVRPGAAVPAVGWLVLVGLAAAGTAALVRGLGGSRVDGLRAQLYASVVLPAPVTARVDAGVSAEWAPSACPPGPLPEPVGAPS